MKGTAIFLVCLFCFESCATILSIRYSWNYKERLEARKSSPLFGLPRDPSPIYGGTFFDYKLLQYNLGLLRALVVIDIIFSFILDTILLPITILLEIVHSKLDEGN